MRLWDRSRTLMDGQCDSSSMSHTFSSVLWEICSVDSSLKQAEKQKVNFMSEGILRNREQTIHFVLSCSRLCASTHICSQWPWYNCLRHWVCIACWVVPGFPEYEWGSDGGTDSEALSDSPDSQSSECHYIQAIGSAGQYIPPNPQYKKNLKCRIENFI